jgi:hypothetical protein
LQRGFASQIYGNWGRGGRDFVYLAVRDLRKEVG